MTNQVYYNITIPPRKETTYRDIKEKLRDLHGMGELGVFINTLIKHTTRNKAEKEKAELEHKLELFMPISPESTNTYSKTKQKI